MDPEKNTVKEDSSELTPSQSLLLDAIDVKKNFEAGAPSSSTAPVVVVDFQGKEDEAAENLRNVNVPVPLVGAQPQGQVVEVGTWSTAPVVVDDFQGKEDEAAEILRNVHVPVLDFDGQRDEAAEHLRNVHVLVTVVGTSSSTAPVVAELQGQQDEAAEDLRDAPAMVEAAGTSSTAPPVVADLQDNDLPLLARFFKALLMIVCWCCSNEEDIQGDDDTQSTLRRTPASPLPLSCTCIYEFTDDDSPPLRRYICGYHYKPQRGDEGASPRCVNDFNNPVFEDDKTS